MVYHGILIDIAFKNRNFIRRFKVIGSKKSERNPWTMYKVEVPDEEIENVVIQIQKNLSRALL